MMKGEPNEESIYNNIECALAFAVNTLKFELENITLWGFSFGSGPSLEMAKRYKQINSIILHSPISSLSFCIDEKVMDFPEVPYDPTDMFYNVGKIENINARVLLIHGETDTTLSIKHSTLLFKHYNINHKPEYITFLKIQNGDHNEIHNEILSKNSDLTKEIALFLSQTQSPTEKKPFNSYKMGSPTELALKASKSFDLLVAVFSNIDINHPGDLNRPKIPRRKTEESILQKTSNSGEESKSTQDLLDSNELQIEKKAKPQGNKLSMNLPEKPTQPPNPLHSSP